MRVFNYASYAQTLELGISKPNMTKIAKALFEPIISMDTVLNRNGNPYTITPIMAKAWWEQTSDIPGNVKIATGTPDLVNNIGEYFSENIIDGLINQMLESKMYSAMVVLIRESDLQQSEIDELLQFYQSNESDEFLGRAFLYSVVKDNLQKDVAAVETPIDADIRTFKELIKKSHKKPVSIVPPDEIEEHELGYVQELYRVYHEETGEEYARPADLDAQPKLKKNFNRQRKDYYCAETIHRELRDTIRLDETEGFDILKNEMFDGVITTCEKDYDSSLKRLTAVMEHATEVPISHNLQDRMLDWVGPGEKKGVCHMLVNDRRLTWVEDEEDD
ncbi:MAG: ABC-three component system protein [Suipraeoptans sp.]